MHHFDTAAQRQSSNTQGLSQGAVERKDAERVSQEENSIAEAPYLGFTSMKFDIKTVIEGM